MLRFRYIYISSVMNPKHNITKSFTAFSFNSIHLIYFCNLRDVFQINSSLVCNLSLKKTCKILFVIIFMKNKYLQKCFHCHNDWFVTQSLGIKCTSDSADFWFIFSIVFSVVSFSSYNVIKGWQEKSWLCSLGWKSISGWRYP